MSRSWSSTPGSTAPGRSRATTPSPSATAAIGTPAIAATQKGIDLALVGNYTGSASRRSIDDTMAVVASGNSGIDGKDLKTLRGKRMSQVGELPGDGRGGVVVVGRAVAGVDVLVEPYV
ncbi:hypothetical protein ACWEP4_42265, partial [Streptomyces sp. NPDC004227]